MNGIYWDGWIWLTMIVHKDSNSLNFFLKQAGLDNVAAYYIFLSYFKNSVLAFRFIVLASTLTTVVCLYGILSHHNIGTKFSRLIGCLFSLCLPTYYVFTEISVSQYSVSMALFSMAFFLHTKVKPTVSLALSSLMYFTILLLFYFSFTMNSLLVVYTLFLLHLLYQHLHSGNDKLLLKIFKFLYKNVHYLALPIVFWALRPKAYGLYAGYNDISLSKTINLYDLHICMDLIFKYIFEPFRHFESNFSSIVWTLLLAAFIWLVSYPLVNKSEQKKPKIYVFFLGLLFVYVALFPYIAVNKLPYLEDWESRHAIVLNFALGFFLTSVIDIIAEIPFPKCISFIAALVIAIYANQCLVKYRDWDFDWYKQVSIIYALKKIDTPVASSSEWIFRDNMQNRNALYRSYRFYELTGLLTNAYGNQQRLAKMENTPIPSIILNDEIQRKGYLITDYNPEKSGKKNSLTKMLLPQFRDTALQLEVDSQHTKKVFVAINESIYPEKSDHISYLRMKYLEFFEPDVFENEISGWVQLEVRSIE